MAHLPYGGIPRFTRFLGIDYSGAETPTSRLIGLQVFQAALGEEPLRVETTAGDDTAAKHMRWNWTRKEIAHWLLEQFLKDEPIIVGIDHAFSFTDSYFCRYGLKTWDEFLDDFVKHWPTDKDCNYVDFVREGNPRTGMTDEYRLTDRWTSSA